MNGDAPDHTERPSVAPPVAVRETASGSTVEDITDATLRWVSGTFPVMPR